MVVSGQLTAFLRARWGLNKVRGDSDRHHALDAAVVAACSHSMVKRLSDYARRKELGNAREGLVDMETGEIENPAMFQQLRRHFPDPWSHFREELESRLKIDDPAQLRTTLEPMGTYPPEALESLRPLFVSRAPQRRSGGALHQETIRSAKLLDKGLSYVSVKLQSLKLTDLDRIVGAYRLDAEGKSMLDEEGNSVPDKRNETLVAALRQRLEAYGGDGKKAFAQPFHKPSSDGKQAPLVRSVKLLDTQKGGLRVRGGVADLGAMDHVDVFRQKTKLMIMPSYAVYDEDRVNPLSIPDDAEFLFSLSKNDYMRVTLGGETHEGYFVMYESDGRLTLRAHDQPQVNKTYFRKSISSAAGICKFHVDVLGNVYPAPLEPRHGLA